MEKVAILDTTLRDGEQAPGYSMHPSDKLEIALQLEKLGVDIIEAGFASSNSSDNEALVHISKALKTSTITTLCRLTHGDIDAGLKVLDHAKHPRLHLFIASSPIHLEYKLKMTEDAALEKIHSMLSYAKRSIDDIQFSFEDASRSDLNFLYRAIDVAISAGATTINLPDTVGYATPNDIKRMFGLITKKFADKNVVFSTHCHNDLGMAVANTLTAIEYGARQAECTINGIGERAGNAPLEEVVMALKTRKDYYQLESNIVTTEIYKTSSLISSITGVKISPSKAIVGRNAFKHESGIHQHGVMCNRETYEIMQPADIGIVENNLVLGKHSGKHAFSKRLKELGYNYTDEIIASLFEAFKALASRKKLVSDKDLESLIINTNKSAINKKYRLRGYSMNTSGEQVTATIELLDEQDNVISASAVASGPVDASYNAINSIVGKEFSLEDYSLSSVTEGEDAVGVAVLRLSIDGITMSGRGISADVIEASILAYLNGVNKLLED